MPRQRVEPTPLKVTEDGIVLTYAQARELASVLGPHPLGRLLREAAATYWRQYP